MNIKVQFLMDKQDENRERGREREISEVIMRWERMEIIADSCFFKDQGSGR